MIKAAITVASAGAGVVTVGGIAAREILRLQSELKALRRRAETAEARLREPPTEGEFEAARKAICMVGDDVPEPCTAACDLCAENTKAALIAFLAARTQGEG